MIDRPNSSNLAQGELSGFYWKASRGCSLYQLIKNQIEAFMGRLGRGAKGRELLNHVTVNDCPECCANLARECARVECC